MAVVKFEENGQAYFDWLEGLTSEKYVSTVKKFVADFVDFDGKEPLVTTSNHDDILITEIFNGVRLITVTCDMRRDPSFVFSKELYVSDVIRFNDLKAIFDARGDQ